MKLLIAAITLALSGLCLAESKRPYTKAEVEYLKQGPAKGKAAVLNRLKDPDSATFKNTMTSTDRLFWCGEVNAKNSFGGYIGFKRFFTLWGADMVWLEGSDDFVESLFFEKCS